MADHPSTNELKAIDAPIEVLLFDPLTRPIAARIAKVSGPLPVTYSAFLARLAGTGMVVLHLWYGAAVALFLGFVLDAVDGKVARIRRVQVGIHGTVDFLLDQVALVFVLLAFISARRADGLFVGFVLAFLGVYLVYTAIGGTRLRILGDLKIDWRQPGSLRTAYRKFGIGEPTAGPVNSIIRAYVSIQDRARGHRLLLRTTGIEAQFVLLIITPALRMSAWPVLAAVGLMLPDLAAMGIATLRLAHLEDIARGEHEIVPSPSLSPTAGVPSSD